MKLWWLPWLFPGVLLGAVLLTVVLGNDAAYLGIPVGFAGFVAACLFWRARFGPAKGDPDADVKYWRLPGPRPRA